MSTQPFDDVKQLLLAEQERLQALVSRTAKHLYRREEPYDADFEEQAVETQNNEVVEQIDREAQLQLAQVEKALQRIDQGEYNICARCGGEISGARLKALPHTDLCINCAD